MAKENVQGTNGFGKISSLVNSVKAEREVIDFH